MEERQELLQELVSANYQVRDFTDNELAKLHVRYMIGGKSPNSTENSNDERRPRIYNGDLE